MLEQLPAIRRVLVEERKNGHLDPTWQDVSVLESINAAMKPLADFTDVLSGENYVTVSSVKPVMELMKGDLLSPNPEDTTLTARIKENVCRVLTEKYGSPTTQVLLRKSTILDPRYRGSMEEAEALDNLKHQLLQELLDLKEPEESGVGTSGESYGKKLSSERMFSTAGNIATPERSCLKPHKVNILVLLARNLPN